MRIHVWKKINDPTCGLKNQWKLLVLTSPFTGNLQLHLQVYLQQFIQQKLAHLNNRNLSDLIPPLPPLFTSDKHTQSQTPSHTTQGLPQIHISFSSFTASNAAVSASSVDTRPTHQNVSYCVAADHLNCKMLLGIQGTCVVFLLCECRCAAADQMGGGTPCRTCYTSTCGSSCLDRPFWCAEPGSLMMWKSCHICHKCNPLQQENSFYALGIANINVAYPMPPTNK